MTKMMLLLQLLIISSSAALIQSTISKTPPLDPDGSTWNHDGDHSEYSRFYDADGGANYRENLAENEWKLMLRSFDGLVEKSSETFSNGLGQMDIMQEIELLMPDECRQSLSFFRQSIYKHKLWALKMLDSFGKIPSGVTYGRFSSPGDFEECLNVRVDEQWINPEVIISSGGSVKAENASSRQNWRGKYCLLDFRLPVPERPKNKLLSFHEPLIDLSKTRIGKEYPNMLNISKYALVFYYVGYMHSICLPSTCQIDDVTKAFNKVMEGAHISVFNSFDCEVRRDFTEIRSSQWLAMLFFCVVIGNAMMASVLYWQKNKSGNTGIVRLAKKHRSYSSYFSIQSNFYRLTKPDPGSLTFVHYTRIFAMAMTIITHTAGLGTVQAVTKVADAINHDAMLRDFLPQMLCNAFTTIQVFFFMAGFMLVLSAFPSIKREHGKLSFVEYSVKRAIRLMPGITTAIMVNFLWPLVADGPLLTYITRAIVLPCETHWWQSLFFLSNLIDVEKMCLRHSYFSASDYQLHIVAFPVLLLLYHKPMIGLLISGFLTLAGFIAQVVVITTKTALPFILIDYLDKEAFLTVVHSLHHPVWNHTSAFFFGVIVGYFVVEEYRSSISQRTKQLIWYTIVPLGLAAIFAPYYWNHYKRPIHKWQMILYIILDRAFLLLLCGWIPYATMVLGKEKKTSNNKANVDKLPATSICQAESKADNAGTNLPIVVSVTKFNSPSKDEGGRVDETRNRNNQSASTENLTSFSSTPNFPSIDQSKQSGNLNLSSIAPLGAEQKKGDKPEECDNKKQHTSKSPSGGVSSLNTLCLIFSRLTFQLYLFNMVVIWFDVTHSKYVWHISYYFVIVKAFGVYIASAILSMLSFVLLESPTLTLYINWVKYRAKKRGEKEELRLEVNKDPNEANEKMKYFSNQSALNMCMDQYKMQQQQHNRSTTELLPSPSQHRYGQHTSTIYDVNSPNMAKPSLYNERERDSAITRM